MEWVMVKKFGPNPIGAIGFLGDDAVMVLAFYDDLDGNKDGKVSFGERVAGFISPIKVDGSAVVEVAMQARVDPDIIIRDPSFARMSAQMFANFAKGIILDGIYATYFARGVSAIGSGVASSITSNLIKGFVIRKGFESAVKTAFKEAVGR